MSVGDAVVVLLSAASPRLALEEKLRASLRRLVSPRPLPRIPGGTWGHAAAPGLLPLGRRAWLRRL